MTKTKQKEIIGTDAIRQLIRHIGKEAVVEFAWRGCKYVESGEIKELGVAQTKITIGNAIIPFKSECAAIQSISTLDGVRLYLNPYIDDSYGKTSESILQSLRKKEPQRPVMKKEDLVSVVVGDKSYVFRVELERDEPIQEGKPGPFVVSVPKLPGCLTQGYTEKEAIGNAREAIEGYLKSMISEKEVIPEETLT